MHWRGNHITGLLDSTVKWWQCILQPWERCCCGMHDIITIWYGCTMKHCNGGTIILNAMFVCLINVLFSAALEVSHVESSSFVLRIPGSDQVNTTFHVEVDGRQWAVTRRSVYIVSGLTSDRSHTFTVRVRQNGVLQRTLRQTVHARQLSEWCSFHSCSPCITSYTPISSSNCICPLR